MPVNAKPHILLSGGDPHRLGNSTHNTRSKPVALSIIRQRLSEESAEQRAVSLPICPQVLLLRYDSPCCWRLTSLFRSRLNQGVGVPHLINLPLIRRRCLSRGYSYLAACAAAAFYKLGQVQSRKCALRSLPGVAKEDRGTSKAHTPSTGYVGIDYSRPPGRDFRTEKEQRNRAKICEHGRRATRCPRCQGGSCCVHGRTKGNCRECKRQGLHYYYTDGAHNKEGNKK